jgi:hypothetical protein
LSTALIDATALARWRRSAASTMGRPPRLTDAQKAEARRRRAAGATLAELARSYDVSRSTISRLTICSSPISSESHLEIPAGVERQLVVGEHIGAALRRREVRQDDARHLVDAEHMRGAHPAVAGDNAVLFVDQQAVEPGKGGCFKGNQKG